MAGVLIAGAVIYGNQKSGVSPNEQSAKRAIEDLPAVAEKIGLDRGKFETCLAGEKYDQKIAEDLLDAENSGGQGTPWTVVLNSKGGTFPISGALPFEAVKKVVEEALKEGKSSQEIKINPITSADHIFGNPNAGVKIVEFSDLQCPFCARFHPTLKQIIQEYDGQVAWVYRHFPLASIHPSARPAAIGSECAAELGGNNAFWKFVDAVFAG